MKEIIAYQCADGSIHATEKAAKDHEDDLLGQDLELLIRLFSLDISRNQEFSGILTARQKRDELLKAVLRIANILEHGAEEC